MILAGQLLLAEPTGRCRLAPGHLMVKDGVIQSVIEGEIPTRVDAGGEDYLITPGFIDTHLHLPQFDMIGGHGMSLLQWLQQVTFPAERRWEDTDYARTMTHRVLKQCLSAGTTAICAYATVHAEAAAAALDEAIRMDVRGVIGHVLMDQNAPEYLCRSRHALIDQSNELLNAHPSDSRMAAAVTPRFAISCSPELLLDAGKLARQHHAYVQTHLAETLDECKVVAELFGGQRYVDVYEHFSLLTSRTLLGHGIHLDSSDQLKLANAGSIIAHCPTANSFLRSGSMSRQSHLTSNVRVTLGSDIGAGYERSMVRVARAMIETASQLGRDYPSAPEAWYTITRGNAEALGWEDAGSLVSGAIADLALFQPDIRWLDGQVDPLSMLMFAWDDRWIRKVFLRGREVSDI